jgi:hypothetical protein
MSAQSFVIEDALSRKDVADEIEHLATFSQVEGKVTAYAVTFLTTKEKRIDRIDLIAETEVIGQATVITFPYLDGEGVVRRRSYVYEAVFRTPSKCGAPPAPGMLSRLWGSNHRPVSECQELLNNYVPISKRLAIPIGEREIRIPASYFCEQNKLSSCCAHCAVRTIVNTVSADKDGQNVRVSTRELNALWPEFRTRNHPRHIGIGAPELEEALGEFGLHVESYNLDGDVPWPLRGDIADDEYTSDKIWNVLGVLADSASASLLMLSSEAEPEMEHVVPLLGHTFNSDEWHPFGWDLHQDGDEMIVSSAAWIDHLVMHDDMLGPYYCLSRGGLFPDEQNGRPKPRPRQVIAVMPKGVSVSPIIAETIARKTINHIVEKVIESALSESDWWTYFLERKEKWVLRTTLVESKIYMATLVADAGQDPVRREIAEALSGELQEHVWLVEVTLPNLLLANRTKLGEILIDPTIDLDDRSPSQELLAAVAGFRMPSVLGLKVGKVADGTFEYPIFEWPSADHREILANRHPNWW